MLKNGNQFSLDGGIPAWTVEGDDLAKVNDFLKKSCMEFSGSLPGDEKDEDGYSLTGEAKDATASRNGLSRNQMGIEEKAAEWGLKKKLPSAKKPPPSSLTGTPFRRFWQERRNEHGRRFR